MNDDTIAALSTPLGRGGIAVIRISGELTTDILRKIIDKLPEPVSSRRAYHGFVVSDGRKIDECIVVFFKKPRSYTGEDMAELSIHSNPFIIEEVLDLIFNQNARKALSGEFTYRAFKNGKMDLIQAEAINALVNSSSRYFSRIQIENIEGKLSELLKKLKENLIELGIRIETVIEFEEDQFLKKINIEGLLKEVSNILEHILSHSMLNEILNRGFQVIIVGKVNVGKSSLFNTLLLEERAIVSEKPGTTRDFIKEKIYLDGFPFEIIDIAGINLSTTDEVEIQGIKRGYEKIKSSDAVIFMLDAASGIDQNDLKIFEFIKDKKKIIIANKMDLVSGDVLNSRPAIFENEMIFPVSVKKNQGIEKIFSFFKEMLKNMRKKDCYFSFNHRQKKLFGELNQVIKNIEELVRFRNPGENPEYQNVEIIAEEIRGALQIIGQLTGEISAQDILNGIFSQFCVGK